MSLSEDLRDLQPSWPHRGFGVLPSDEAGVSCWPQRLDAGLRKSETAIFHSDLEHHVSFFLTK